MKFEFAKYTEVTDLALKLRPSYLEEGYTRFFICPDVWDYWFVRILKGYNEDYEEEEGSYLLERNKIPKEGGRSENLSLRKLKEIILEDELENWDIEQSYDVEELVDMLDNGFGILNRK